MQQVLFYPKPCEIVDACCDVFKHHLKHNGYN